MNPLVRAGLSAVAVSLGVLVAGCGVSKEQILGAKKQIDSLITLGIPDSMFTYAKVAISEAEGSMISGDAGSAGRSMDTVTKIIANAQQWYQTGQQELKPQLEMKLAQHRATNEQLTGPQRVVGDTMLAVATGLLSNDKFLQARVAVLRCDTAFDQLVKDEARMKEVAASLPGLWGEQEENKELGVERTKKIRFNADGTFALGEEMKGKTAEDLKEDWSFTSSGNWKIKGDTVFMNVTREKRVKMELQRLVDGKWKKEVKPPYDSSYTDGRKDVMIEFTYMQENMKKAK